MNLQCPYCNSNFSSDGIDCDYAFPSFQRKTNFVNGAPVSIKEFKNIGIMSHYCPECKRQIMWMYEYDTNIGNNKPAIEIRDYVLLYPKRPQRIVNGQIPEIYAKDLSEALQILEISPKASAALSRRCLQSYIHEEERILKRNLEEEISKLIAKGELPKYIADDLDYIRSIGNFAAHPKKYENSGEIIEVEVGEAEWTAKTLEKLLVFHFAELAENEERRNAFKAKYKDKIQ